MAQSFNITAKLQLEAGNFQPVINSLQQQLGGFKANINAGVNPASARAVASLASQFQNLQQTLATVTQSANAMNQMISRTGGSGNMKQFNTQLGQASRAIASVQNSLNGATSEMFKFGQQAANSGRRFLAFTAGAIAFVKVGSAIREAAGDALEFQRNMVKLSQLGAVSNKEIGAVADSITRLSTGLGVSSKQLADTTIYLKGAGLNITEVKDALEALAKTSLAPTFRDIRSTTEGLLSISAQFKIASKDYEAVLGSINSVAREFAAESEDIIEAVRRSGAAFKAASGDFQSPKQSLNEFIALFTSVRSTTRESAESIATSFKTIFTRLQSNEVVKNLKDMGINLRYTRDEAAAAGKDIEGQFIGGFKAVQKISAALKGVPTTDPRFASVVQQIGGTRQVSKVIPLLTQASVAQKAYQVAVSGTTSLTRDADKAQEAFTVRIAKLQESFTALVREISQSKFMGGLIDTFIVGSQAAIALTKALTPLVPLLTSLALVKIGTSFGQLAKGFAFQTLNPKQRFATGGVVRGHGGGTHSDSVHGYAPEGGFFIRAPIARKMSRQSVRQLTSEDGSKGGRMVPVAVMPGEVFVPPKNAKRYSRALTELNKGYSRGGFVSGVRLGASVGTSKVSQTHNQNPFTRFNQTHFAIGGFVGEDGNFLPNPINRTSYEGRYGNNADRPRRHSADKAKRLFYARHRAGRFSTRLGNGGIEDIIRQTEMRTARYAERNRFATGGEILQKGFQFKENLAKHPLAKKAGRLYEEFTNTAAGRVMRSEVGRAGFVPTIPAIGMGALEMLGSRGLMRVRKRREERHFLGGLIGGNRPKGSLPNSVARSLATQYGSGIDFSQFGDFYKKTFLGRDYRGAGGYFQPEGPQGPQVVIRRDLGVDQSQLYGHEYSHAADHAAAKATGRKIDRSLPYASALKGHRFNDIARQAVGPIYSQVSDPEFYEQHALATGQDPDKLKYVESFAATLQAYGHRQQLLAAGHREQDLPSHLNSKASKAIFSRVETEVLPHFRELSEGIKASKPQISAPPRKQSFIGRVFSSFQKAGQPELLALKEQYKNLTPKEFNSLLASDPKTAHFAPRGHAVATTEQLASFKAKNNIQDSPTPTISSPKATLPEFKEIAPAPDRPGYLQARHPETGHIFKFPEHLRDDPKSISDYHRIVTPLANLPGFGRAKVEHALRSSGSPDLIKLASPGPKDEIPLENPHHIYAPSELNRAYQHALKRKEGGDSVKHKTVSIDAVSGTGRTYGADILDTKAANPSQDLDLYEKSPETIKREKLQERIQELKLQGVTRTPSINKKLHEEGLLSTEEYQKILGSNKQKSVASKEVATTKPLVAPDIRATKDLSSLSGVSKFVAEHHPESFANLGKNATLPKVYQHIASEAKQAVKSNAYEFESTKGEGYLTGRLGAVDAAMRPHGFRLGTPQVAGNKISAPVHRLESAQEDLASTLETTSKKVAATATSSETLVKAEKKAVTVRNQATTAQQAAFQTARMARSGKDVGSASPSEREARRNAFASVPSLPNSPQIGYRGISRDELKSIARAKREGTRHETNTGEPLHFGVGDDRLALAGASFYAAKSGRGYAITTNETSNFGPGVRPGDRTVGSIDPNKLSYVSRVRRPNFIRGHVITDDYENPGAAYEPMAGKPRDIQKVMDRYNRFVEGVQARAANPQVAPTPQVMPDPPVSLADKIHFAANVGSGVRISHSKDIAEYKKKAEELGYEHQVTQGKGDNFYRMTVKPRRSEEELFAAYQAAGGTSFQSIQEVEDHIKSKAKQGANGPLFSLNSRRQPGSSVGTTIEKEELFKRIGGRSGVSVKITGSNKGLTKDHPHFDPEDVAGYADKFKSNGQPKPVVASTPPASTGGGGQGTPPIAPPAGPPSPDDPKKRRKKKALQPVPQVAEYGDKFHPYSLQNIGKRRPDFETPLAERLARHKAAKAIDRHNKGISLPLGEEKIGRPPAYMERGDDLVGVPQRGLEGYPLTDRQESYTNKYPIMPEIGEYDVHAHGFGGQDTRSAVTRHVDDLERRHYQAGGTGFNRRRAERDLRRQVKASVRANEGVFSPSQYGLGDKTLAEAHQEIAKGMNVLPEQNDKGISIDKGLGSLGLFDKLRGRKKSTYSKLSKGLSEQGQGFLSSRLRDVTNGDEDLIQQAMGGDADIILNRQGGIQGVRNKRYVQNRRESRIASLKRGISRLGSNTRSFFLGGDPPIPPPNDPYSAFRMGGGGPPNDPPNGPKGSRINRLRASIKGNAGLLLGGAAAAAQFAPDLINYGTGDFQNPGQFGVEGVRKGRGIGGALSTGATYAAIGGSVGGPVGAIVGGAVGALHGFISATKEADKELRELNLEKTFRGLDTIIEGVTSGRMTATVAAVSVNKSLSEVDSTEAEQNTSKSQFQHNAFGNGLRSVFGEAGVVHRGYNATKEFFGGGPTDIDADNAKRDAGARAQYVKEHIAPRVGQLRAFATSLAHETKISDPNILKSVDAYGQPLDQKQLDSNRDARLEEFKKRGGRDVAAKIVESDPKMTFDAFYKEIDATILEVNRERAAHESLTKAITSQEIETAKFLRIGAAIDATVASMKNLQTGVDSLEIAFSGQLAAIPEQSHADAAANFGGLDTHAFNKSVDFVTGGLSSRGKSGLVDNFGQTAKDVNRTASVLPEVINNAAQEPALEGEGLIKRITKGLGGHELPDAIVSKISDVLGSMKPEDLAKQAGENVGKLAESIMKDGFANVNEVLQTAAKALEERANNYNQGLVKNQEMINKIGESQDKYAGLQVKAAASQARVNAEVAGRPGQADLTLQTQLSPIQQRQERLSGLTGRNANDPVQVAIKLAQTRSAIIDTKKLRDDNAGNPTAHDNAARELVNLQGNAQRLGQALEDLANPVEKNAILQEKLNRLEASRDSKLSFTEKLITASPEQRRDMQKNANFSDIAVRQGSLANLHPEIAQGALEHLSSLGEAELPGYGGRKASDVRKQLLVNTGLQHGILSQGDEKKRVGLMQSQANNDSTAAEAQAQLVDDQASLQSQFFTELTKLQSEFFNKLSVTMAEAAKKDLEAQIGTSASKLGKATDASNASTYFQGLGGNGGLTPQEAQRANVGSLAETIQEQQKLTNRVNRTHKELDGNGDLSNTVSAAYDNISGAGDDKQQQARYKARNDLASHLKENLGLNEGETTELIGSIGGHARNLAGAGGNLTPENRKNAVAQALAKFQGDRSKALEIRKEAQAKDVVQTVTGSADINPAKQQAVIAAATDPTVFEKHVKASVAGAGLDQAKALDDHRKVLAQKASADVDLQTAEARRKSDASVAQAPAIQPLAIPMPKSEVSFAPEKRIGMQDVNFRLPPKQSLGQAQRIAQRNTPPPIVDEQGRELPMGAGPAVMAAHLNQTVPVPNAGFSMSLRQRRIANSKRRIQSIGADNDAVMAVRQSQSMDGTPVSPDVIKAGALGRANQLDRMGQGKKAAFLRSQAQAGKATGEMVIASPQNLSVPKPSLPALLGPDASESDKQQYARQRAAYFSATGRPKKGAQELKKAGIADNPVQAVAPPTDQKGPGEQAQQKGNDPMAAFSQNIQALGGIVGGFDKTISNMSTTLSNLATIFKDLKIPEKITVERSGEIQVVINGGQLLASLTGDVAKLVQGDVINAIKQQLPGMMKDAPAT